MHLNKCCNKLIILQIFYCRNNAEFLKYFFPFFLQIFTFWTNLYISSIHEISRMSVTHKQFTVWNLTGLYFVLTDSKAPTNRRSIQDHNHSTKKLHNPRNNWRWEKKSGEYLPLKVLVLTEKTDKTAIPHSSKGLFIIKCVCVYSTELMNCHITEISKTVYH